MVPEGIPLPISTPLTQPLPVATLLAGVPSLSPILQVGEEEEEEQEEEGFVDLTESINDFEVFNQLSPHKNLPDEMGIQKKPKRSLQELLESQPGKGESRKSAQPKLPPPPPRSPPRAPLPTLPFRTEQVDPKKRREQKGKDIMETGKPRPSSEKEAHRATKQQKVSHAPSRGVERADNQFPKPQAWLPAPMLSGEPLMDDASIRDFNGGIGCYVALALEQTHLLPKDMVEL